MTAITLNLLAEEQQAQAARAHDPLKIFIAINLAVLSAVVACGSVLSLMQNQKSADLQTLQVRWNKMNIKGEQETEFQRIRGLAEEIVALNHSRTLVAPQLAMVKDLIPPTVQLSQIHFALIVETPNSGGDETKTGKKVARPASVERLILRMEGTAFSSRPELEVDRFLQTLRQDERFSAVVDDIQLRSISRSSGDASTSGKALPAASFAIECRYKGKAKQ